MIGFQKTLEAKILRKPDVYFVLSVKSFRILLEYWRYLFAGIILVSLMVAITGCGKKNSGEILAVEKIYELAKTLEDSLLDSDFAEKYDVAKKTFLAIMDEAASESTIRTAQIALGNISYAAGIFDMAISMYSRALEISEDVILRDAILDGLAHSYLANGDLKKALFYFELILSECGSVPKEDTLFNISSIRKNIENSTLIGN